MHGVTRLSYCEKIAVVTFHNIPLATGLAAEIFQQLAQANINIDMVSQTAPVGETLSISFTCSDDDLRRVLDVSRKLREQYPQIKALVSSGNCKLQLYGEEMRTTPGVFARALSALAESNVELLLITTSEIDISLLIASTDLENAIQALNQSFAL